MRRNCYLMRVMTLASLMLGTVALAQDVVQVGKGSYASYTPYNICHSEYHEPGDWGFKGDQSKYMQYRPLYIHERPGQPIPTNDWWTDMLKESQPYSGHMWAYPQYVQAQSYGIDVQAPSFWMDNGTELLSNTVLKVAGADFHPECAVAQYWHDWDVAFSQTDGQKLMYTTLAHGMPFTWIELRNVDVQLSVARSGNAQSSFTATQTEVLDAAGRVLSGSQQLRRLALRLGDDAYGCVYGIYLPEAANVSIEEDMVTVTFQGSQRYVSVAVLHSVAELDDYAAYACHVPRSTEVTWRYDASAGKLRTYWTVNTEDLDSGVQIPDFGSEDASPQPQPEPVRRNQVPVAASNGKILQGFMPHQYRDTGNDNLLPLNGQSYPTPHGKMKMAEGVSGQPFEIDYNFYGMLPYYAVPTDVDREQNAYHEEWMTRMLRNYADNGTFGGDTYWGGKGLTQMALYMMFAREMGNEALFIQCRDRLKAALTNWLTYTPGETSYFFARYDRWGALVGYSTSYDSDTFNDHHFHYGYFTYAAALLALVDDDFKNNYGEMITLIAKDYANWDREDTRFPFFRTFDPWAGHSFAGGMGDGNGNGQESSSEAMQSWGGLYLLGVALGNEAMRDAGIFGWVSEARGTAEYWFDRHHDASIDWSSYHQHASDDYNIDYDRFRNDQGAALPYNSNLTCQGVGWWTYFGYNSLYMSGIQWMPISPALDYLSEDKDFVNWDVNLMLNTMYTGSWTGPDYVDANGNNGGHLGNAGGWGNVTLSYLQRGNPEQAAQIFDECYNNHEPEFYDEGAATNGISYFVTHSHLSHGDIDWTTYANIPTARVYQKADGTRTYMAYNPDAMMQTVTFSDGYQLQAIPRQLTVSGMVSKAVTAIVPDEPAETDPYDGLEMVNLALRRPVTVSGWENDGLLAAYAVDGDLTTRWGSRHADGEWISVDLERPVLISQIRLVWEAAYASQYRIWLSDDGEQWRMAGEQTSTGGTDKIVMADAVARYVKIEGVKRALPYGISLYELCVYGQYADASPDDIIGFKITTEKPTLCQYEPSAIGIKGYTVGGEWVDVTPQWSANGGQITADGVLTPDVYGFVTVHAQVDGVEVSKSIPVEEAIFAGYVSLLPAKAQVPLDEPTVYEVAVKNQFKEPMVANRDNFSYRICTYTTETASYVDQWGNTITYPVYHLTDADAGHFDPQTLTLTMNREGDYALVAQDGIAADTAFVKVRPYSDLNLALGKPAVATSQENGGVPVADAFDGDLTTRWGSQWTDDQSITVDLKAVYEINRVVLYWEAARASEYLIEVSEDGVHWITVKDVTDVPAGKDEQMLTAVPARYVRIQGISRSLPYGYSLYEFEVYGIRKIREVTGLSAPSCDESPAYVDVYTVDGRCVMRHADRRTLPLLRPGIYLIDGERKVVK